MQQSTSSARAAAAAALLPVYLYLQLQQCQRQCLQHQQQHQQQQQQMPLRWTRARSPRLQWRRKCPLLQPRRPLGRGRGCPLVQGWEGQRQQQQQQ